MSGAGAPANRRGARLALCAALALAGLAVVLTVTSHEPARRDVTGGEREIARAAAALPAAVASPEARAVAGAPVRPTWQPPVAARARRDDGVASGPARAGSPSFESHDWREEVAAVMGRAAVEGAPLHPGTMHTHVSSAETAAPEARAPALPLSSAPVGGEGIEGWDGGKFWFGPNGLVRMREAQR